ncbi:hypothetical protein F503_02034 [Ophiostoma piceae UAMH 11346]|uniref:DUF7702 domain-containing protein n=1 Tax=Ophiostoma piceae (strain UAMH 11346) TaxID=1262450 RepID=S3BV59_OPHP1|nr:hypothetical protein F503_02034 [Ophiostoma piceae UAMH 11346]
MTLTIYNKISIIDLVFFLPALAIAGLLTYRHGFRRSSGWIYLVLLSLMRILGSSMQLATIKQPDNINIIIGAQTLQNIGLSPLILVILGLITRVQQAIPEQSRPRLPNSRTLRLIQLTVIVGLILIIVGGINMGNDIGNALSNGEAISYTVPSESKAGIALMIVGYVLIVVSAGFIALSISSVPSGEKRLIVAIFAAMPFVLVRLVYSSMATFNSSNDNFHQYSGSANAGYYVLGMCTVMEIASVLIFETVGLTLPYASRNDARQSTNSASGQPLNAFPTQEDSASEPHYFPKERESVQV